MPASPEGAAAGAEAAGAARPTSLNWREIDLVLTELDLPGSLIQEVHQPRHDRFVLHLFKAGRSSMLLVSLAARLPRMHAVTERMPNPEKPPRFATFLRARVKGGRVEQAEQVRVPAAAGDGEAPGERVVRIGILRDGARVDLWVRLWASAANALLTGADGVILDAFYRRPRKGEVSGREFDPAAAARAAAPGQRAAREYSVRDLPGPGTFNERLERAFGAQEGAVDVGRAAAEADAELEMSENKMLANLQKLRARLSEYAQVERFKELGDLVTSGMHLIRKGDRWLRVQDFYHGEAEVEIELAPGLTPAQNAEAYYERHRKARLGRGKVEEEIRHLQSMVERIRERRARLAENPDTASLERTAREAARARKPLQAEGMPGLVFSIHGHRLIVGRTAAENDELLRRKVRGNDWWFHARDWPGAYVFVKAQPNKSLPLEIMLDAAMLAVHFSRGKTSGQGDVYYTRVKYLRRAKGAKKGTVLPTQEKNLHVKVDPRRIEQLKSGEGADGDPA
jgi:predicted ribosome quality control (RQC) complex YloA/Tae2 family protein